MNLSAPFVRRPIGTILLSAGIALAGIAAFFSLPVSPLPQVDYPTVSVSASLPGASPETMATSVATPLERRLGRIADVNEMTSRSNVGSTNVTLQFNLDRDIDGAARDVQAAINAARVDLPATLRSNPTYRKQNPADAPIIILALTSKTKTPGQIYDAAATIIQQQLSQVSGVGDVTIGGGSLPAVRVELNPTALAHYGIALEDVRAALASANANRPKGAIQGTGLRYQIYANDAGTVAADYAPLVIAFRNGSAVRLEDIADVQDGVEDVHNLGLVNGQPAILVIVSRQPAANIISTVDAVKAQLPALRSVLPEDINMQVAADRTLTIRASLSDVERAVLFAVLLVIGVVAFFLHNGKAVLIPSIAVAISLFGALAVMYLLGFSLDNLSLMALTVATGFVVDDAIVVLENATRHVEEGVSPMDAALQSAAEVGFTVLSISISLVAVFTPILLMGGIVGRLFREFAITLSAAVLVSLVVSLTTTPMLAAYLVAKPPPASERNRFSRFAEGLFDRMHRTFEKALDWSLASGPIVLTILAGTIALSIFLFTIVPKGFFPTQDTGQLMGGLQSDQSSSFQLSQQRLRKFVSIVQADPSVQTVVAFAGGQSAGGFFQVVLKPRNQRHGGSQDVINRLRPKLAQVPGANLFLNAVQDVRAGGRASNSTYQYTLQADSLDDLHTWGEALTEAMKAQPALTDVNSDQQDHGLQSFVTVDRDKIANLGLTSANVDNALYDAFGQRQVSTIYEDENQYHVIMEAAPQYIQDPTALDDVYVSNGKSAASDTGRTTTLAVSSPVTAPTPGQNLLEAATASTGPSAPPSRGASQGAAVSGSEERLIPLSAFAQWADGSTPTTVNHQDSGVATTISFNLAPGKSLSDATTAIRAAEAQIGLPATIHGSFQGTAKVYEQSLANEPVLIGAAIVAVYLVLGMLYESYIHPLTVLSTLPSAGLGAVIALILFHIEFTIIALIGVILLIGIVKKNAILIIDFAIAGQRDHGLSPHDAIRRAALIRFRPIMMTTFAALFGALPLALGWGEGSELRQPLGITIIGGLLVSQILTLITTPVVYLYLDRFHKKRASRRPRGASPQPLPQPA